MAINNAQSLLNNAKAAYDIAVGLKDNPDTIFPEDVSSITELLEPFVEIWERTGYADITEGTAIPDNGAGQDTDIYYRLITGGEEMWRKENGTWVLKRTRYFTLDPQQDGISRGLRTFINDDSVTVSSGSWFINNALYNADDVTGFTIADPDASLTRIDLIYVTDADNSVQILQGTPGAGEPDLPDDSLKVDAVIVQSVADGGGMSLESGGSDLSGAFVPILGVRSDPDSVTIRASFSMDTFGANPFDGSGCQVEAFFGSDPEYGSQQATADDAPARKKIRTKTAGTWSEWISVSIPFSLQWDILSDDPDGMAITISDGFTSGSVANLSIPIFQSSPFVNCFNPVGIPTMKLIAVPGSGDPVNAGIVPELSFTLGDGYEVLSIQWQYDFGVTIQDLIIQLSL